jgi:uncharacterized protein (TIGR00369 family)
MTRRPIEAQNNESRCFGCGPSNPSGLRLKFVETDEGVEVEYTAPAAFEGPPGIVHGGIQATLLDEALCMTAYAKLGTMVVTGELTVRYLRPVPTLTALVARCRIIETKPNSSFIEGSIHLAETGEELTRAHGRFFPEQLVNS